MERQLIKYAEDSDKYINELADDIKNEWNKYKHWYSFEGGEAFLQRKIEKEDNLDKMLSCAESIIDMWKLEKDLMKSSLYETAIYISAKAEWGYKTTCHFDTNKKEVKISDHNGTNITF